MTQVVKAPMPIVEAIRIARLTLYNTGYIVLSTDHSNQPLMTAKDTLGSLAPNGAKIAEAYNVLASLHKAYST